MASNAEKVKVAAAPKLVHRRPAIVLDRSVQTLFADV